MKIVVDDLIKMLQKDIGFEDITTKALIQPDLEIKARIVSNQGGVVAGVDLVSALMREFSLSVSVIKGDGEELKAGHTVLEIKGEAQSILALERTVLNLLMKMSGIATVTNQMLQEARKTNPEIIVAGTRKTTPGMLFWEKEAVRLGGGDTHRYRLDDAVLIKDNHLALVGDVEKALKMARKYASFIKKIEIEVENLEDVLTAANAGADIIMLDNMSIDDIKLILEAMEVENLRNKVLIEVSGGITPDNIAEYAETGVEIISSGYITHSAGVLDMSLEII